MTDLAQVAVIDVVKTKPRISVVSTNGLANKVRERLAHVLVDVAEGAQTKGRPLADARLDFVGERVLFECLQTATRVVDRPSPPSFRAVAD